MSWDALHGQLENELGEPVTLDAVTGGWRLAQRARGHRHSVDDVLTARYALDQVQAAPPSVALDLGSGIGGVGLLVLWGLPARSRLICVEAQAVSHRLLTANIAGNQLGDRVEVRLGDLRQLALPAPVALITGSPPYFPIGSGILPTDAQKAHARFELRGDVGDYATCAARHLTDDGVFVCCFPTAQQARALARIAASGLHVTAMRQVIPRAGLRPLFSLFACRPAPDRCHEDPPFVVRDASGEITPEMREVRRGFGFE
ncbi:MAG TPA: hypothetical protein VGC42_01190 [Kofleriaceae bacterium]